MAVLEEITKKEAEQRVQADTRAAKQSAETQAEKQRANEALLRMTVAEKQLADLKRKQVRERKHARIITNHHPL